MPIIAFVLVLVAITGGYVVFFRHDSAPTPEPTTPVVTEVMSPESTTTEKIAVAETISTDSLATPTTPTAATPVVVPRTPTQNTSIPTPATNVSEPAPVPDPITTTKTVSSQTISYRTPARNDNQIAITVSLTDNTISDVSVNYNNGDGVHNNYQKRFNGDYRSQVIGKNISDVSLSRVGGASLTSKAFNDALASVPR